MRVVLPGPAPICQDCASRIVDACGPKSPDSHRVVWGLTSRPPVSPAGFPPAFPFARRILPLRPAVSGLLPSAVTRSGFPFAFPPGFLSLRSPRFGAVDVWVGHGACRCASVERCSLCSACSGVNCQCCHHRPRVRSRTKALCVMPCRARLLARCWLPRKAPGRRVRCRPGDAGEPRPQRSSPRWDTGDDRINQLNESSPGGSHEVAFGRGSAWAHWLTSA